jgi:rhamnogalacturonyl hydrolase YesR
VIIDNMMNLELLFWATRETGDSSFYKIAVTHANTTIKNHYRADYSSYHVINYNPETGAVQQKKTAQGFADESAWARGQVWGLYGFTVMYRETKDKKYLEQAKHIAEFILNNPNLPADKIPYWDFHAPNIPNALRDASAGAIMASALLELCRYTGKSDGVKYFNTAQAIIKTLSSSEYKAAPGTNGGFILKHSVGHFPQKSEVDVAISYADYYFVEAMKRYTQFATK